MTVTLDIEGYPCLKPKVLHPSLEKLFGQIMRWKDLSFNCDYSIKELLHCDRIPSASLPVLSTLRTSTCVDVKNFALLIGAAPNLQSLSLAWDFQDVPIEFSYYSVVHTVLIDYQHSGWIICGCVDVLTHMPTKFVMWIVERVVKTETIQMYVARIS
jgi:hypothetical protein